MVSRNLLKLIFVLAALVCYLSLNTIAPKASTTQAANGPITPQVNTCCGISSPDNPFPCDSTRNNGNCTWWVFHRRKDVPPACRRNAHEWALCMRNNGYVINKAPLAGAIVVFPCQIGTNGCMSTGYYQHVAYIEAVHSVNETTVDYTISQMSWGVQIREGVFETNNCNDPMRNGSLHRVRNQSLSKVEFIHLPNTNISDPYEGVFDGQSFQMVMDPGIAQEVQIKLKNTGTAAWDNNTKIYALPLDQPSPFYDSSWLSPYRITSTGVVQPGESGLFKFTMRAPSTPGDYRLEFAFVQEGIAWFNEPSPGAIWIPISVAPSYRGQYVAQDAQLRMTATTSQIVRIQVKNTGTAAWDNNTKIYALPLDQPSPFYDASWLSPYRITSTGVVQSGESGLFEFTVQAPSTPGDYRLEFAFVQEGTAWFNEPSPASIWLPIRVDPLQTDNTRLYLPLLLK